MSDFKKLSEYVEKGNRNEAKKLTQELLAAGQPPLKIVEEGLVPGMSAIGEKFKNNQVFVPEMLIAARAMKECMAILEPLLVKAGIKPKYTAIIGTVPRRSVLRSLYAFTNPCSSCVTLAESRAPDSPRPLSPSGMHSTGVQVQVRAGMPSHLCCGLRLGRAGASRRLSVSVRVVQGLARPPQPCAG